MTRVLHPYHAAQCTDTETVATQFHTTAETVHARGDGARDCVHAAAQST